MAESFFATIKRELIDTRSWPTRAGLQREVFAWIEGWSTPAGSTPPSATAPPPKPTKTIHPATATKVA